MIKKLLLSIVILVIGYILLIFIAPNIAGAIEKVLGINGFNNYVIKLRNSFNNHSVNIPSTDKVLSGALNFKNNIVDGVDTTKEKIDSFRETMSGVEDTYNNIKNGYKDVQNFINTNSGKIDDAKKIINNVSNITSKLTNTGTTN